MTTYANPLPATTGRTSIWFNGRLLRDNESAEVPVDDHGLVVGDGVFEALKITADGAFAVRRHLDRLDRSAASLGLPKPDRSALQSGIDAVVADRDFTDGKIRLTYTGGRGPLGSGAAYGPPTVIIAAAESPAPPATTSIVTVPWLRNERGALTGVKSTSYAENVRALAYAGERDCSEAIFANTAGALCEGTGTNIFCVFGDEVITPPLSAGCLAGITRELILEWCEVIERDLTVEEALAADEVFITSSLRDVQAVERWDETDFASEGPHTDRIRQAFADRSTADLNP